MNLGSAARVVSAEASIFDSDNQLMQFLRNQNF